jgi:hypothetical protein
MPWAAVLAEKGQRRPSRSLQGRSIECESQGDPMIEQSLIWVRNTLAELGISAN